ncbi:putative late blight resistance protein homolog R1B-8 [Salvia hispanica]|uniref:putative late blight resistance protein homolog R1B-8 n=1 Tax=Salvia hispanica TaxID=49212 RepID=UPI0020093922|nr:putative late blight resistance protein homolog R1B-8 [Salvia hispanica]
MAYNLQPLITILEGILDPRQSRWIVDENNPQLQSLLHKATSLQKLILDSKSSLTNLDTQIREVAHQAEDIIESHMVHHMLSGSDSHQAEKLMEMEDKKMLRELDSATEQAKLVDKKMPSSSSSSSGVVGIDADLMQLKDRLAGMQTKLEIVPIVEFDKHKGKGIHELKDILYKSLYGRKYLIVLDDIWSTKFWDEMRMYFPVINNGSRILITTRESDVVNYTDSSRSQHQMQLLSESESWNLLHQLVFGEEECPPELQEIGQKIAKDCDGLPLAISVIGGLLSKMERSEDAWRKIGDNVIAAISESDERCYSILSLSYDHLPNHLKPCFLYMGAYPEDFEIKGSKLILLWVAEGFVKSNGERSLEEEAEDWLKSLIDRNLFQVRKYERDGNAKSYSMHDLLRVICIRKCSEEEFMNGPNKFTFPNPRRMSFHTSDELEDVNDSTESMSLTRSLICIGFQRAEFPLGAFSAARLLRVLDLMDTRFDSFPTEIFELINLRFDEAAELWKLCELRYLTVDGIELLKDEEMNYSVLLKLQSIVTVNVDLYDCELNFGAWRSLCALNKLEVFTFTCCNFKSKEETNGDESESEDTYTWDEEWELEDGDVFPSLHFLTLKLLYSLPFWTADKTNFPRLRQLRVAGCCDLYEIPSGIGEIPTLELIELVDCTKSTVASAKRIINEQSGNGNNHLKLYIDNRIELGS